MALSTRTFSRKSFRVLLCIAATLGAEFLLTGCGTYLYSKTRDDQVTAAKTAWRAVDTKALFDKERERLAALLKQQQENEARLADIDRTSKLRLMSSKPLGDSLAKNVTDDLDASIGTDNIAAFKTWKRQRDAANGALGIAHPIAFGKMGLTMPACKDILPNKEPQAIAKWRADKPSQLNVDLLNNTLPLMRIDCETLLKPPSVSGELGEAWADYRKELKALETAKGRAADAQAEYRKTKDAYEKAVDKDPPKTSDEVAKAKEKFLQALQALAQVENAFSAEFLNKEKAGAVDEFLTAFSYDPKQPITKGPGQIAALTELIPQAIDTTRQQIAQGRMASMTPLLVERNSLELKAAAAAKDAKAQEAVVELSKKMVDVEANRANRLVGLNDKLEKLKKDKSPYLGMSLTTAQDHALGIIKSGKSEQVQTARNEYSDLESMSLSYLDTLTLESQRTSLGYQRSAAYAERKVAYNQDNVAQWTSAIDIMMNQMSDYHRGGFTADDFLKPLNAATLLWIGVGVN